MSNNQRARASKIDENRNISGFSPDFLHFSIKKTEDSCFLKISVFQKPCSDPDWQKLVITFAISTLLPSKLSRNVCFLNYLQPKDIWELSFKVRSHLSFRNPNLIFPPLLKAPASWLPSAPLSRDHNFLSSNPLLITLQALDVSSELYKHVPENFVHF